MNEEKELKAIKLEFEIELKNLFNRHKEDVGLTTTAVKIIIDH